MDGKWVLTDDLGDKEAAIWDAETGSRLFQLPHQAPVYTAVFDPSGTRVATGSADMTVKVWNAQDGTLTRTLAGHKGEIRLLAFSPSGKVLLTGSSDATAKLWFEGENEARYTLTGHARRITALAFNGNGSQIATGSYDGTVRLWDFNDGSTPSPPDTQAGWVLYGWLDTKSEPPRLRAQSLAREPDTGIRNELPKEGDTVKALAFMNVRDNITRDDVNKRWNQGKPVDVLAKGQSVKVLAVQWDKNIKPPAVWVRVRRN
ncbi:MAG: hypothetical protein JWO08_655 [Verrucomicrobiaceae bacterium]|nr:hypothetical protein [Verrucomicrobiaceae bacterium]